MADGNLSCVWFKRVENKCKWNREQEIRSKRERDRKWVDSKNFLWIYYVNEPVAWIVYVPTVLVFFANTTLTWSNLKKMYFSIEHMSQFRMQNTFNLFKLDNFFHLFIKNILIIIKNHIQIIIQNKNETKVESNRCGAFCMEPNTLNRSIPIYFQSYPLISRFLVHFTLEFFSFFLYLSKFF